MKFFRSRVFAVVVAAFVLVGLGAGGAVARDLVTGRDVKNRSLHGPDLATDTIGRRQLREGGVGILQLSDFVRDKINQRGPRGFRGAAGSDGRDGRDGVDGSDGQDGVSGYEVIGRGTDAVTVDGAATVVSKCAEGEKVLSGGVRGGDVVVKESYPSDVVRVGPDTEADPAGLWAATSWTSVVEGTGTVQPYLICADISG